jgi:hypothetical protein
MATRAAVVSVSSLSRSIDRAVALAAKRHDVTLGGDNLIYKWELLGRVLRNMKHLGPTGPTEVAATIATAAKLKGTPVAAKIGRDILVGVIPYDMSFNIRR